jgi:hypothetical protein
MLQYLDLLAICPLSPSFKPQLQRYTGEDDAVNHLTLSWILMLIRACALDLDDVKDVDARREVPFLIGYKLTMTDWDSFQARSSFNSRIRELLHQTLPIKVINLEDTRDEDCNTYRLGSKDLSLYFITNTVDCLRDDDDDTYRLSEGWRRSYIKDGVLMVVARNYEEDEEVV